MKILIVDDSRFAVNRLKDTILSFYPQCEVISACDGNEALTLVQQSTTPFSLAFLDYNMPGMNGLELADQLKAQIPMSKMVMLSANASFVTGETQVPSEMCYIKKPIAPTQLKELLALCSSTQKETEATPKHSSSYETLSSEFRERLSDLFLKGAQNATSELSSIMGKKYDFLLTLPNIEKLYLAQLKEKYLRTLVDFNLIRIFINAPKEGVVFMIFSNATSKELVHYLAGQPLEGEDFVDAEKDILGEIGNVMMNTCLIHICQNLGIHIVPEVPELHKVATADAANQYLNIANDEQFVYFCVEFKTENSDFNGQIGLMLGSSLLDGKIKIGHAS